MRVRAKFTCNDINDFGGTSREIKLAAVYPTSEERAALGENESFNKATPFGELRMIIDNPDAAIQFEKGKSYYLDFSEAP